MATPNDIKTVVGLFRVSTEEQEQEGNSLDAQKRMYKWDCQSFNWKSLATFSGQETGTALGCRRIIHEVISALREHHPDALWVREQSRLTRGDYLDVGLLLRELRENDVCVVTERGYVLDLNDIEGEFTFGLKALIDRREYQVIRRRSNLGKDEKARRGLLAHGRPAYGYVTTGTGRDKGLRVPQPEEAPVVRRIFELAAGGRSMRQIAQELSEHGIKPPASCGRVSGKAPKRFKNGLQLWSPRTVRRFLDNPIYLGVSYRNCWVQKGGTHVFEPHNPKAIWVENAHEPLVSQATWDAANHHIAARTRMKHQPTHMLTGILRCPHCGSTYAVEISATSKRSIAYYVCGTKGRHYDEFSRRRRRGDACPAKWKPVEQTDRLMWAALTRLLSGPEMILAYLERGGATVRRERLGSEIAELKRQRTVRERKIALARDKLLTEIFTDGEYLTVKGQLEDEIRRIARQIQTKEAESDTCSADATEQVIHNLAMLKLGERKLSQDQRRVLFRALVRRITPQDETFRVCEIELNADIAPQLVEAEHRPRAENITSQRLARRVSQRVRCKR